MLPLIIENRFVYKFEKNSDEKWLAGDKLTHDSWKDEQGPEETRNIQKIQRDV